MKQRLFVDMDGTLAEFKVVDTLETLYEPGYFYSLKPQENVVEAIKLMTRYGNEGNSEVEVYVLSAYLSDSNYALNEKNAWLDKYLPEIDKEHRLFLPCGEDKWKFIKNTVGDSGNPEKDYLLDDYSINLHSWDPPARGIKLMNGINGNKGTWANPELKKNSISVDRGGWDLFNCLKNIIHDGALYNDALNVYNNIFNEQEYINQFKQKTTECFHDINRVDAIMAEALIREWIDKYIDINKLNIKVEDVVIYGSRCRGVERDTSDLDVILYYSGNEREDDVFNALHDFYEPLNIDGIPIDINPKNKSEGVSLSSYLEDCEVFLSKSALLKSRQEANTAPTPRIKHGR